MNEPTPNRIAWIDTETTGLDTSRDLLLEIAVVVTDDQLSTLGSTQIVIGHTQEQLNAFIEPGSYVERMHTQSGLLDEVLASPFGLDDALGSITALLFGTDSVGSVVAGNTIGFDRAVITTHLPTLNTDLLHYRNIDVSSFKEAARRYRPDLFHSAPLKGELHRAAPDIHESIAELRHYLPIL